LKKREFATRLLFWLLPWPISRALPRSLRIYYFGPSGGPPPGFYDYWGVSGFYWPDPEVPIDPDLFPDLPDDIFNPVDPVDPTPPDDWPDLPDWPSNPSDPYTPGPGPIYTYPQPGKGDVFFDQNYWDPLALNVSWQAGHWHGTFPAFDAAFNLVAIGTWFTNYRPSYIHISWSGQPADQIHVKLYDTDDNQIAWQNAVEKDFYLPITYDVGDYDIEALHFESRFDPEEPININLIEFL